MQHRRPPASRRFRPHQAALLLAILAAPALAIQPGRWVHSTEADFNPGKSEHAVVTNLGDIKLSLRTEQVAEMPEKAAVVYDLQPIGEDLYISAGPEEGKLLRRRGEAIEELASLRGEQIFAMDADEQGRLVVAVSAANSRIARLENDELVTLIELPGVRYVWDIIVDEQRAYLATGAEGLLLSVDLDRAAEQPAAQAQQADDQPVTVELLVVDGERRLEDARLSGNELLETLRKLIEDRPERVTLRVRDVPASVLDETNNLAVLLGETASIEIGPAQPLPAEDQRDGEGATVAPATVPATGPAVEGAARTPADIAGGPATVPATGPAGATEAATQPAEDAAAALEAHPAITVLLDAAQNNLLNLGRDGQGRLYAGSDTDGLIYRVSLDAQGAVTETFVVYDAPEPEIGALLVMEDGTIYAGTADAEQARPGRLAEAATAEVGRPERPVPVPVPVPVEPDEPEVPGPGDIPQVPPDPEPIGGEGEAEPADEPTLEVEAEDITREILPQAAGLPAHSAHPMQQPPTTAPVEGAPAPQPAAPAEPTREQRDQLRQVIRERLERARQTGELQTPVVQRRPRTATGPSGPMQRPGGPGGGEAAKPGNAVYRISPDGFVQELFRESTMVLKLVDDNGRLLAATGNEGLIYSIDPVGGETSVLADLEPQQVPAMLASGDGELLLGTANPALLVRLETQFAEEGTFTSAPLDAGQISLWGVLHLTVSVPEATSLEVQTRSGNVQDPERAAWSNWSDAQVLEHDPEAAPLAPRELEIASPPARFLQYRVTLRGQAVQTPVVERIELAYVVPNIKPTVAALRATYPGAAGTAGPGGPPGPSRGPRPSPGGGAGAAGEGEPAPETVMTIEWEANDPNNDRLRYTLEYQPAGSRQWLPLAEDLEQTTHEWQTRRVPDGRYLLRVTASDAPDNTPDMALTATRQSDPIVVDNTPPALADVRSVVDGRNAEIRGAARDALSPIRSIHYAVDSTEDWRPVLPDDLIFDSTRETFTVRISDLSPGPHVVTLRALDSGNNAHYEAVFIEVR